MSSLQDPVIYKITKLKVVEKVQKIYASRHNAYISEKGSLFIWGQFMDAVLPICLPFEEENVFEFDLNA